jgi:hypothetical protein
MRRVIETTAVVALSAAMFATVTGALLDDAHAGGGASTFMEGTVDLSVAPVSAAISFTAMAPGDRATAPLTVSNDGTLRLRYAVTSTATNVDSKSLAHQLELTIKAGVAVCSDGGFAAGGSVLYGPADLGSVTGIDVVGEPSPGRQSGDRTLDAGDSEELCIRVAMPSGTGNAFQGASTAAAFMFVAEPVPSDA